jgi:hypothetical protein
MPSLDFSCALELTILVVAYQFARILDPVTFDTIKILPSTPGAVNNCESRA